MNSLKSEFEVLLIELNRHTFEHVRFHGIFIDEPEFLVVIYHQERPVLYLGGYLAVAEELGVAILSHAAEYLKCSVFDPELQDCKGRVVSPYGDVWFCYNEKQFNYVISTRSN